MNSRMILCGAIGTLLNFMVMFPSFGQIIPRATFGYEYVSWGNHPSYIQELFGITWVKTYTKQDTRNIGSGRSDVHPRTARMFESGIEIYVQFEFTDSDSELVSVTMIAGGLPGFYDVPGEFVDHVWDTNVDRFGEPEGGKWIPLIGESKEWTVGNVFIKMIRMNLPASGILVKYVLMEEKRAGDEDGAVRDPSQEISTDH